MYLTNLGHSILTNLTLSLILEIIYPLSAQVQASRVQAGTGAYRGLIFVALSRQVLAQRLSLIFSLFATPNNSQRLA